MNKITFTNWCSNHIERELAALATSACGLWFELLTCYIDWCDFNFVMFVPRG